MDHKIGSDEFRRTVLEVINEHPEGREHVYKALSEEDEDEVVAPSCTYLETPYSESCLVGRALMRLGVSQDSLSLYENVPATNLPFFDLSFTSAGGSRFFGYLQILQGEQDAGQPWGYALDKAERYYQ